MARCFNFQIERSGAAKYALFLVGIRSRAAHTTRRRVVYLLRQAAWVLTDRRKANGFDE
jgi:hypothetical protein